MKRGHLTIIFTFILLAAFMTVAVSRAAYNNAVKEKGKLDYALQLAADSAAEQLAEAYSNVSITDYLESVSDTFFASVVAGLGIYEDTDRKAELDYYVPALLVTHTDGFYINYLYETREDGSLKLKRAWTECQPYYTSDEYFIYKFYLDDRITVYEKVTGDVIEGYVSEIMEDTEVMADLSVGNVFLSVETYKEYKRAAVSESIARVLDRTVNEHSRIAGQFGISILYNVPEFLSNYTPAQEYPSFIAVFQGYPLVADVKIIYNNASTAAAYISVAERYVVEVSTEPNQPFSVVHRTDCSGIGTYGMLLPDKYKLKDAITIYGTYGCPRCFSEGDNVAILP